MVRLVNSGTEATMARCGSRAAFTGRDRIVKFDGCYHGHADGLLVKAGSGARDARASPTRRASRRTSPSLTLSVPYNDLGRLRGSSSPSTRRQIAAVIVEPVVGNMGVRRRRSRASSRRSARSDARSTARC